MSKSKSTEILSFSHDFHLSVFRKNLEPENNKSLTSGSISPSALHVKVCKSKVFSTPDSLALLPTYGRIIRFQSKSFRSIRRKLKKPIFKILCYQLNNVESLRDLIHFWLIRQAENRINLKCKLRASVIYSITGIFKCLASSKVSLLPLHFSRLFLQQTSTTGGKHYGN